MLYAVLPELPPKLKPRVQLTFLPDDHDVSHIPAKIYFGFFFLFAKENVRFCSKGISSEKSQRFVTLDDAFQMISREALPENSVFIKMDIEQSEFRVLPDLLKFEEYITGMVVEFHDLDILWPKFSDLMNELKAHFEITHIHGNNYGGLILNSRTPKV